VFSAEPDPQPADDANAPLPRIEVISTQVPAEPAPKRRKVAHTSSALWVPLKASPSAFVRTAQLLLPSGWALLAAGILLAWRLLIVVARGDLGRAGNEELVLAAVGDLAIAHAVTTTLRAMSLTGAPPVTPTADVTRSASLMLAAMWMLATLLRMASLVMAAIDKKPIDASFFAAALRDPLGWLSSGAFWVALGTAAASAAVVRYCLTCDMETAQALSEAESKRKFVGGTLAALAVALALASATASRADRFGPQSVAHLPEIAAMRALNAALHDPALRATDE